jgi:hypothetical protein
MINKLKISDKHDFINNIEKKNCEKLKKKGKTKYGLISWKQEQKVITRTKRSEKIQLYLFSQTLKS